MAKMNDLQNYGHETLRKKLLDEYRKHFEFRVSIGKSSWIPYESFNPAYNLREILPNEIVIEFDEVNFEGAIQEFKDKISWCGINFTGINLYEAGYTFEIWDHQGKSPHLHIHNLPIGNLQKDQLRLFKKVFIRKYVPREYLPYVDISLTGIHLIALEWQYHWKGCYAVKRLLSKFEGVKDGTA